MNSARIEPPMLETALGLAVPLVLGAAAGWLGLLGILLGEPLLATASLCVIAALDLARRRAWRVECVFLGAACGVVFALRAFRGEGVASLAIHRDGSPAALLPEAAVILLLAMDRAIRQRAAVAFTGSGSPSVVIAIGFALATTLEPSIVTTLRIFGNDGSTLAYASAPLLLLAAAAAAAARFVARRHPQVSAVAIGVLALGTLGALYFLAPAPDDWLTHAAALQAPTVSRRAFLFGASLLAVSAAALPIVGLAGLAALLGRSTRPTLRFSYFAIGLALGAYVPTTFALPASLLAVAIGCSMHLPRAWSIPVLGVGALTLGAALLRPPQALGEFVLRDPVWQYDGSTLAPAPLPSANGRPDHEDDPPGWPFQMDALDALFALLRRGVPEGAIGLLGDEAPSVAARAADPVRQRLVLLGPQGAAPRPVAVRVVLPSCFTERLRYFAHGEILAPETAPLTIVALDLAEVDRLSLRSMVRIARGDDRDCALLLHGRHAFLLSSRRVAGDPAMNPIPALTAVARAPLPVLALGPAALERFASLDLPASRASLLLGGGRERLAHRSSRLAAANLRTLLGFADALDGDPTVPAPFTREPRVRLALAAAILDDDAQTEDRLLDALDLLGAEDAPRLRVQRGNAREALLEHLLALRDSASEKSNADVHFRLGRILARRGDSLAALIGLTRTIELRSQHGEGWVALAEAFADAEDANEQRVENGVALEQRTIPWQLIRQFDAIEDPMLLARIDRVFGRAHLANAGRLEGSRRNDELSFAMARFHRAWTVDPSDTAGLVLSARTLAEAKEPTALNFARLAVASDPLVPAAWEALAACSPDRAERERALRSVLALSGRPPR